MKKKFPEKKISRKKNSEKTFLERKSSRKKNFPKKSRKKWARRAPPFAAEGCIPSQELEKRRPQGGNYSSRILNFNHPLQPNSYTAHADKPPTNTSSVHQANIRTGSVHPVFHISPGMVYTHYHTPLEATVNTGGLSIGQLTWNESNKWLVPF